MSDDKRKVYSKKGTGTVPKIKYAKNTIRSQEQEHNVLSNNLGRDSCASVNRTRHLRNSERSPRSAYRTMERPSDQNSVYQIGNEDVVTKCDNITKYPDKKQIEDKLNQIRECLNITSSIVSNMKNSDDQSYNHVEKEEIEKTYEDLKDSEAKLCRMLSDIDEFEKKSSEDDNCAVKSVENGVENIPESIMRLPKNQLEKKVEQANRQLELLQEQENLLLTLQLKAENQLREARRAQHKLLSQQNSNMHYIDEVNSHENNATVSSSGSKKDNHDIADLEDQWSGLRLDPSTSRQSNPNQAEHLQNQVEMLTQKVGQLRDTNDNRTQLIQLLDKRDVQLQNEHAELQGKLWELQNKKRQVDQLVSQLQNMNDESEEDDMGSQVRKIVVMKEQLSKLKDMLEIVKNSENSFESPNVNESDTEEMTNAIVPKSHNLIQNDVRGTQFSNEENLYNPRTDNNPARSSNEQKVKDKQVNKKTMNSQEKERLKLQAELQAKKRELEELMCKHKAASSNLNQDVQCEYKPDMAAINNTFEAANYRFYPASNIQTALSGPYSSDEGEGPDDDVNEYSEVNSSGGASNAHAVPPMPPIEVTTLDDYLKNQQSRQFLFCPERPETRTSSRTADNNSGIQPISNTTGLPKERVRNNSERDSQNKTQTQKQLELIRSVCDSMLEQRTKPSMSSSQNVRNNLTPSPLYSEPRQFSSPNPHPMNALNIVNNLPQDGSWCAPNNVPNFALNDASSYQNWLATNTLQTQTYMLNTLNQCCQMLWLQQREIASLRNNVVMLQEKLQIPFDHANSLPPLYMNPAPCTYPNVPKPNQHQVSSATSLPNLNHPHAPATNLEYVPHSHNNLHNARILESGGLNNTIHQVSTGAQMWNGPALNNQVAPGNRANNYWDNFRSYSRQNLLSTKSNDQQPSSNDRLNNTIDGSFCYPFSTLQKRNGAFHDTTPDSSVENTPRRRLAYKSSCPLTNLESIASVPPDVLNINEATHVPKTSENNILLVNTLAPNTEPEVPHSNLHEVTPTSRNRNEWSDEGREGQPKSKLFGELRENVYKEVASLISANQGRPHFLLQLFRDLQLISSDPLRRQTLQSIQSLVSDSLVTSNSATDSLRQMSDSTQNVGIDSEVLSLPPRPYFAIPPFTNHVTSESSLDSDCPAYLSDVLTFLNLHSEEVLQQNLLEYLKDLLVESTFSSMFTNSNNPKDSIIQKHFACLVGGAFEQFKGKKVQEVRLDILQTIEELLRGEILLIRLMRESISETNEVASEQSNPTQSYPFDLQSDILSGNPADSQPPIQNGDLAEADQSRMDIEEEDEEGAVGGIINTLNETNNDQPQITQEELENSNLDFTAVIESEIEFSEQGLDQVPTRLSAHRSKINSSRDRSNSSRSDTEQL